VFDAFALVVWMRVGGGNTVLHLAQLIAEELECEGVTVTKSTPLH